MTLPRTVKIVEVGPRDGLQNESKLISVPERRRFIDMLSQTGLSVIEVGSFVSPKWVPQMAKTGDVYEGIEKKAGVQYPVLVPNQQGLEKALEAGVTEIAVFVAASETFSQKNINCGIQESFERLDPVVKGAREIGMPIRGYISCVMGCPYEGDVPSGKVVEVAERLLKLGCLEISLGDTIGVGTPLQTRELIRNLSKTVSIEQMAVHFHDTYGQALANILTALEEGISVIDSSVAGIGGCPYAKGASGNVVTEDLLFMLTGMGIETGVHMDKLLKCGKYITKLLGINPRSKVAIAMGD
ncbi:MAG: hydroxymethylglutaryl-CoA lyase [Alphaproteobacteria bacterium]|jgi:hydroxymethylglutaryl-CoA lyase|nr:hydroxymethylglutaryl-CoA lyase [Alphaproteobacteria bacterium]MBT5389256.1 hydroxymethylglutaryl-CoA lyase [Alphaproteobacteria bacterium]MBT5541113.1 hydroxymethylglutaryl-CoA lyase [Alphaproteobacteria bacterium]MBT5654421.1 hydroxymethylglutaryl-CoA lyase [Alphaproteobacteria bacterium]